MLKVEDNAGGKIIENNSLLQKKDQTRSHKSLSSKIKFTY